MYNAAIKTLVTAAALSLLTACSNANPDAQAAQQLVAQADTLIMTGDYQGAINTLDTLKTRYPKAIDAQRAAIAMRPIAIQGLTVNQIEETDRQQAYYAHVTDSLKGYFALVHDASLGNDYDYFVVKDCKGRNFFERTGLEGRVTPTGEFYIISSLIGNPVKHTSLTLSAGNEKTSTETVPYDNEINYRSSGAETITFTGAQADSIGQFLCNAPTGKVTISYNGAKRDFKTQLSPADRMSLIRGFELGRAMTQARKAESRRRLLEQQLALSRDQMARTSK